MKYLISDKDELKITFSKYIRALDKVALSKNRWAAVRTPQGVLNKTQGVNFCMSLLYRRRSRKVGLI